MYAAQRLLETRRLQGTPVERLLQLEDLVEDLYWATHPDEANVLRTLVTSPDDEFQPFEDEEVEAARQRYQMSHSDSHDVGA